jgi:hypothetical protein
MLVVFANGPWENKSLKADDPPEEYCVPLYEASVIDGSMRTPRPTGQAVYKVIESYDSPSQGKILLYACKEDYPRHSIPAPS